MMVVKLVDKKVGLWVVWMVEQMDEMMVVPMVVKMV